MSKIDWDKARASRGLHEQASPRVAVHAGHANGSSVRRLTGPELEAFAAARGVAVSVSPVAATKVGFTAPSAPTLPQAERGRGRLGMKAAAAVVALRTALRARLPLPRCWQLRNAAAEALSAAGRASVPPDVWRDGWAMVYDVPNPRRREPWTPAAH